ncbi:hypothetical protein GCM10007919_39650 [Rhizobium indigoferae]|nr:hypothetical protein GCM10007919_39650 [Rhizobium indigoferae]
MGRAGIVVNTKRQLRRLRDGKEMLIGLLLSKRRVGHRRKQKRICTSGLRIPRQGLGVVCPQSTDTDDDRNTTAHALDGGLDGSPSLLACEKGVDPGAAKKAYRSDAGITQAFQQAAEGIRVDPAIPIGGRWRKGRKTMKRRSDRHDAILKIRSM